MAVRAIRGAITARENSSSAILEATTELLHGIILANPTVQPADFISAWFSATADLDAVYPARAARELGWLDLPMMCAQEMNVAGSLQSCIRVLLLCETRLKADQLIHVYIGAAAGLRPDWAGRFQQGDLL